jgi:error-prone DNA polymerase
VRCADLERQRNGGRVEVAGLVLVRQRPGTASGVVFATLEDETGIANLVIWSKAFSANRRTILAARVLAVRGRLQIEGSVIHVVAETFTDMTADLTALAQGRGLGDRALARADDDMLAPVPMQGPQSGAEPQVVRRARAALPAGRNFR